MAEVIRMPKMSDTMEEGVIASWLKEEGDEVNSGDILAEVETDKATMELESYQDGVLLYIGVKEKESVPVDGILAIIGEKGEDYKPLLDEAKASNGNSEDKGLGSAGDTSSEPTAKTKAIDTSSINASIIRMPKMSDTMEEGVIASWLKKVGDSVESGDILAEVETDKATMELEAYEDGTLLYTAVDAGEGVPVDGVIAIIGEKDADYSALLKTEADGEKQEAAFEPQKDQPKMEASFAQPASSPTVTTSQNGRIKASPLAKKIASDKGIDLSEVNGTGPEGRIVKKDVENYTPSAPLQAAVTKSTTESKSAPINLPKVVDEEHSQKIEISQMRKAIAKRLSESKFSAPHFYLTMEINMDKAMAARKSMNEVAPVKISFNDMIVKAVAAALKKHPKINVSWGGDHLMQHDHIHIGVAVAVPDGLIVPVLKFADQKTLSHISAEVKAFAERAKERKLQPEEFTGNTFTISNLGMFGIEAFTAIVNPPDACIMAVGGIKETIIVKEGEMKPGNIMKVTLSCDHRAVDGAVGAAFLVTFKEFMEDPIRILV
ncbi:MAG: pyruvate dehydrogenase complex dihydrolipoamide acetyltransferase [Ekhidna sp.]|nr:pyruvate dehydrogenase complex dihydrolipoamide acetyltransferase [Ekhidna sp.]